MVNITNNSVGFKEREGEHYLANAGITQQLCALGNLKGKGESYEQPILY